MSKTISDSEYKKMIKEININNENQELQQKFYKYLDAIANMEDIIFKSKGVQDFSELRKTFNCDSKTLIKALNKVRSFDDFSEKNNLQIKRLLLKKISISKTIYDIYYQMCFYPSVKMEDMTKRENKLITKAHMLEFYRDNAVFFFEEIEEIKNLRKNRAIAKIKKKLLFINSFDLKELSENILELLQYKDILENLSENNSLVEVYYGLKYATIVEFNLRNALKDSKENNSDTYGLIKAYKTPKRS